MSQSDEMGSDPITCGGTLRSHTHTHTPVLEKRPLMLAVNILVHASFFESCSLWPKGMRSHEGGIRLKFTTERLIQTALRFSVIETAFVYTVYCLYPNNTSVRFEADQQTSGLNLGCFLRKTASLVCKSITQTHDNRNQFSEKLCSLLFYVEKK